MYKCHTYKPYIHKILIGNKHCACLLLRCVLPLLGSVQALPVQAQAQAQAQAQESNNPAPVFQQEQALQVRIEAPFVDVFKSRGDTAEYFPALLSYLVAEGSEVQTALEIKTRGNFRNRENVCRFPPLMLDFPREDMSATVFAGENRLKLVTHCQPRARYHQYVLLEYLSYRIFNLLTEYSMKVRLLEVSYLDSDSGTTIATTHGFLLEDIERLAERLQLTEVRLRQVGRSWYDSKQTVLVALFQYLLGNTDWSLAVGDPGETCCHNIYALQGESTSLIPLPFDFDVTGMVDPSYGSAPRQLGIRRLTERLYRGTCPDPAELNAAIALFVEKRDPIRALFTDQQGLSDNVRERALDFIDGFYAVITDSTQVQEKILGECV